MNTIQHLYDRLVLSEQHKHEMRLSNSRPIPQIHKEVEVLPGGFYAANSLPAMGFKLF